MSAEKKSPNESEISLIRIFDAPVKMVWDAWTDSEQVAKWWGPRGFTITTHHKDVKTGGSWDYIMHGPDGVDYPNKTKFLEVEPYSRMVYDHGDNDDRAPMFRVTVNFSEISGKTKMEMTMAFPTVEAAAISKKIIKKHGGESTWDRLAEYLSPTDKFVINRSFDAPRDVVFEMWTDPKHLSQWTGPTGSSMEYLKADIKVGGTSFYCMSGVGNTKMYGKVHYKEITKPNRLVYTQVFCDENENITRHPMAPTWPETMLTTVTLEEEGVDRTRVTITWEVYGDANSTERETFNKAKGGMTQGWIGSLDKLEEYLKL
jgi:uncharacterized protein YndB with AHSA1/START domain